MVSELAHYQGVHTVTYVMELGDWGTSPGCSWVLSVTLDTGQRWVTAVHADSQHDPVFLLSAGAEQPLRSQPGTENNARQNLS